VSVVVGAVVASVGCSATEEDASAGKGPKQYAFTELVRPVPCFPRALPIAGDGAACAMTTARLLAQSSCDCEKEGLSVAPAELVQATRATLRRAGSCDNAEGLACEALCVCVVPQLHDALAERCRSEPEAEDIAGWCYVAPAQGLGDPAEVANCNQENARELRLFGIGPGPQRELTLSCYDP
jgi:hypothetical protein